MDVQDIVGNTRGRRFIWESVSHGPQFALIHYKMRSALPLESQSTWNFWALNENPIFNLIRKTLPVRFRRQQILRNMLSQDHSAGIEDHYDVSNDLYKLFLDKKYMFYSAARFKSSSESLEEAQGNKAQKLVEFLDPHAGERILDGACGWGPMLKVVSDATGDRVNLHSYTLSRQQQNYVRSELGFQCSLTNFITHHYKPGGYDKIMIIAALEHVRPEEMLATHKKFYAALKPGGRLIYQFTSLNGDPCPSSMICAQVFFPGSALSTHESICRSITTAGFKVAEDEIDDYRPTLRAWFDNLVRNREAAVRIVGAEMYNKYLIFFPASWRLFNEGEASLHRMLILKN